MLDEETWDHVRSNQGPTYKKHQNIDMQVLSGEKDHQDHSCKKLEWMKSKEYLYGPVNHNRCFDDFIH